MRCPCSTRSVGPSAAASPFSSPHLSVDCPLRAGCASSVLSATLGGKHMVFSTDPLTACAVTALPAFTCFCVVVYLSVGPSSIRRSTTGPQASSLTPSRGRVSLVLARYPSALAYRVVDPSLPPQCCLCSIALHNQTRRRRAAVDAPGKAGGRTRRSSHPLSVRPLQVTVHYTCSLRSAPGLFSFGPLLLCRTRPLPAKTLSLSPLKGVSAPSSPDLLPSVLWPRSQCWWPRVSSICWDPRRGRCPSLRVLGAQCMAPHCPCLTASRTLS
ncbi:hypothetical protein TvY486_0009130 [Trypanosoma vivax Y486]|uniref:Uncharacterized protein n=1 Tax=Trypanosoma vivax (strain Y486) TaxID=1055687 RepID=F9WL66_TRYVY|nr:hypothetical protein TvY486_0009130 [Trypanosoma vivax Y486]|eukprot:CCD18253.1 hypothetical protein TvY486_0009130 [Trypanosoma vivax Y486]